MRKLFLLLLLLPLATVAQTKFGYFSYDKVLKSLPQYNQATESYEKLKQRCNDEVERNKLELTRTYVAFLSGHRDFPEPILRKRQKELQQMIDNSIAFRDQLRTWLVQAKDSLYAPCYKVVDEALQRVCTAMELGYAIDIDNGSYKYINPLLGEDITQDIINAILNPNATIRVLVKPEEKEKELADDADEAVVDEAAGLTVDGASEATAGEASEGHAVGEEAAAGEAGIVVTGEEHVEVTDSVK